MPSREFNLVPAPTQAQPDRDAIARISNSWTPAYTFSVVGDFSAVYGQQEGYYYTIGELIFARFIVTATVTHTTAAGSLRITGLPFYVLQGFQPTVTGGFLGLISGAISTAIRESNCKAGGGNVFWSGITKAGYTDIFPNAVLATQYITLIASGSGQPNAVIAAADIPTGGDLIIDGFVIYPRATIT